jgi:hypothetical protein
VLAKVNGFVSERIQWESVLNSMQMIFQSLLAIIKLFSFSTKLNLLCSAVVMQEVDSADHSADYQTSVSRGGCGRLQVWGWEGVLRFLSPPWGVLWSCLTPVLLHLSHSSIFTTTAESSWLILFQHVWKQPHQSIIKSTGLSKQVNRCPYSSLPDSEF